ncbi:MAG: filamentous hemagglutinin N-terminal domain-containing protein [Nostoc sp. JL34]|uniref:two-partner secretion domain-containing protein n=1 Tax=Nostoc sp. JL34 TaxID=2815397 RepID=UPI001D749455|nr:filamentous hemagglutinin N-terminal domain-containing protein [Nostoc sp. JL34]MBN3884244.1 filamentous hemagglutinin N-terminal domain-containing protein [Nostoc sp. JL34]
MNTSSLLRWFQGLGFLLGSAIAQLPNCAIAQIPIIPDGTLSTNSLVKTQDNITTIENGTLVGSNLFHSFKEFSVLPGTTAEFRNTEGVENIISRVTGKSVSNIEGIIKAQHKANLFIINPNGIIFGSNASLQIGGSFVASTASSLNFADGTKFSATNPQTTPLLTVSVPIGLQFGATAAPIHNQSQAKNPDGITNLFGQPVGLQVKPGKTLALVGGDITVENGNLTAASGRIELGSVASNSLVSLKPTSQGWSLGYEGVQNFQNIRLIQRQTVDGSNISSIVDASGDDAGNIQVQGKTVELSGDFVRLISLTTSDKNGGDITITTEKLIVQNGAQVGTSTLNKGSGGNLIVNASKSVQLIGNNLPDSTTTLFTTTFSDGNAGNLTIKTGKLRVQGAEISAGSTAIVGDSQLIIAEGKGGNLTVNASESIELIGTSATDDSHPSGLFTSAIKYGNTGNINITTGQLFIQNNAAIAVDVAIPPNAILPENINITETPGALNITARSILLDNQGQITSDSESGQGGNIALQVRDLLLMRRNSQISTNAGGDGDGGNITIKAPNGFLVAAPFGNSDITANAVSGSGGKITITAKSIFGFVPRTRTNVEMLDPKEINPNNLRTSDITAFSQQNPSLSGTVQINSPDADPSKGLVELPVNLVDASQQIAAGCDSGGKIARSSFITTGRGGLVADPTQPLIAEDAVLADWITLSPESQKRASGIQKKAVVQAQRNTEEKSQKANFVNEPTQIVEAQGWVIDANGNVVLVAQVPTASPHNSSLTATSCAAN